MRILLAFLLTLAGAGPAVAAAEPAVPDFPFRDLRGNSHTLAEFRGKVVLLDFWASWCSPCRESFPFLDGLQESYGGQGLAVVGVSLEDDDEAVRAFLAEVPADFLVGRDPSGRGGEVFEVGVMPTAVLLDRDGKLVARFEGGSEEVHDRMEEAVAALLRGAPLPSGTTLAGRRGPRGNLRAWERGFLADPIMSLDGDLLGQVLREHIHSSKEAAAGNGGVAGGGCGCN